MSIFAVLCLGINHHGYNQRSLIHGRFNLSLDTWVRSPLWQEISNSLNFNFQTSLAADLFCSRSFFQYLVSFGVLSESGSAGRNRTGILIGIKECLTRGWIFCRRPARRFTSFFPLRPVVYKKFSCQVTEKQEVPTAIHEVKVCKSS
jgi:hypothetical protein